MYSDNNTRNIRLWEEESEIFAFYSGLMKIRKDWNQVHLDQLYEDVCFELEMCSFFIGGSTPGIFCHPFLKNNESILAREFRRQFTTDGNPDEESEEDEVQCDDDSDNESDSNSGRNSNINSNIDSNSDRNSDSDPH